MRFSRQYWSELSFLSLVNMPRPWIKPVSPALAGIFFTAKSPGKITDSYWKWFIQLPATDPPFWSPLLPHRMLVILLTVSASLQTSKFSATGPLLSPAFNSVQFSSVQSLSHVRLLVTSWIAARQASLSITNSRSLLILMSIKSVMPSRHLILCHPFLLLPSIPPSIRVFSNKSTLHLKWPKYWSFSFSISPSNEHSGDVPLGWTDWISLQSKGLAESSPAPQFKSINSSVLSLLHNPTLTSIHDHRKNHSLD